MVQK
jgi:hypothetical protein